MPHLVEARLPLNKLLFEHSPVPIAVADPETRLIMVNPAYCQMMGYTEEELLNKGIARFIHADHLDDMIGNMQAIAGGCPHLVAEHQFLHKDGNEIWVRVRASGWRFDDGTLVGVVGYCEDITAERAQLEALREFQQTFEHLSEGVLWADREAVIRYANPAMHDMLGKPAEGLNGQTIFEQDGRVNQEQWTELFAQLRSEKSRFFEFELKSDDGRRIPVETSVVLAEFNGAEYAVAVTRDNTERKEMLSRLRQREAIFTGLFEDSPLGFTITTPDGRFTDCNQSWLKMTGWSREEFLRMSVLDVTYTDDSEVTASAMALLDLGYDQALTKRYWRKDGTWFWANLRVTVVKDERGVPLFRMGLIEDINDQYELRQELALSRLGEDLAAEGITRTVEDGTLEYANAAYAGFMDLNPEDVVGRKVEEFNQNMANGGWAKHWQRLKARGSFLYESELTKTDGTTVPIEVSLNYREIQGVGYNFAFIRNITDRLEYRRTLEHYKTVMDVVSEAVVWVDEEGTIAYSNRAYADLMEQDLDQIVGKRIPDISRRMTQERWKVHWQEIKERQSFLMEEAVLRSDGTLVPVEMSLNYRVRDGKAYNFAFIRNISKRVEAERALKQEQERFQAIFEQSPLAIFIVASDSTLLNINPAALDLLGVTEMQFAEAIQNSLLEGCLKTPYTGSEGSPETEDAIERLLAGHTVTFDKRYHRPDGSHFWGRVTACPITTIDGSGNHRLFMIEDVTESKQNQHLLERQAELERSNQELSQFAYVASHDLKEPLRTVNSFTASIQQEHSDNLPLEVNHMLGFMQEASLRMERLVSDLLDFSRIGGERRLESVDCQELVQRVISNLQSNIIASRAELSIGDLPVLNAYPNELNMIFQNLLANALKFSRPGVAPRISVSAQRAADFWEFEVADNGIGIAPEHQERVFFLFKRLHTREEYEGTGIGLAHCKRAVELHGGHIRLQSEPGKGSVFSFSIPSFL